MVKLFSKLIIGNSHTSGEPKSSKSSESSRSGESGGKKPSDFWKGLIGGATGGKPGGGTNPPIDPNNRNQLLFSIAVTVTGAAAVAWLLSGGSAPEITWKEFCNEYLQAGQVCSGSSSGTY